MTTATPPTIRARNAQYQANVTKRGHVKASSHFEKKGAKASVNPYIVGLLFAVLCGGAIFEILRLFGASFDESSS